MADAGNNEWLYNMLRYGAVGLGAGGATSALLNAIYHATNKPKKWENVIPSTVVNRPVYVTPEQAQELQSLGIHSYTPQRNPLVKAAVDNQVNFLEAVKDVPGITKQSDFLGAAYEGFRDTALPILAGLGAFYGGFRGVDYLYDRIHRNQAKQQYEERRRQLEELLSQVGPGVQKLAEDYVEGGTMCALAPQMIGQVNKIASEARRILKEAGEDNWWDSMTGWIGENLGVNSAMRDYAGLAIGLPLVIGGALTLPKAVQAFRDNNPNRETMREIEERYRDLPRRPQIRLVPIIRQQPPPTPAYVATEANDQRPPSAT